MQVFFHPPRFIALLCLKRISCSTPQTAAHRKGAPDAQFFVDATLHKIGVVWFPFATQLSVCSSVRSSTRPDTDLTRKSKKLRASVTGQAKSVSVPSEIELQSEPTSVWCIYPGYLHCLTLQVPSQNPSSPSVETLHSLAEKIL